MHIFLITIIFILSVRYAAASFTPVLNSDSAIHILMTYDFELPEDLYYWGQDRLGSLVPLLGHSLLKIVPVSPAIAASVVQYFLLLIGFVAFASLLNSNLLKVVLALAWFLPLANFSELVKIAHPYSPQMAFIGIAVVLVNQLLKHPRSLQGFRRQLVISMATASLFVSIWMSDFSVVTALIFVGVLLVVNYHRNSKNIQGHSLKRFNFNLADILNLGLISAIGVAFLGYAKDNAAVAAREYGSFNTFSEIQEVLTQLFSAAVDTVTFKDQALLDAKMQINFLSLHSILLIILICSLFYIGHRQWKQKQLTVSRWVCFFLMNATAGLILLPLSKWVYINETSLSLVVQKTQGSLIMRT